MASQVLIASTDPQRVALWRQALANTGYQVEVVDSLRRLTAGLSRSPALCLLDSDSLASEAQELKAQLMLAGTNVGIIVFVAVPNADDGIDWIRAGARGYANRLAAPAVLEAVIDAVSKGEVWAGKQVVQQLLQGLHRQAAVQPAFNQLDSLTKREHQLAEAVADGLGNAQIAERLGISERTVKAHMSNIFSKLGISSRVQLALLVEQEKAHPPANSGVA